MSMPNIQPLADITIMGYASGASGADAKRIIYDTVTAAYDDTSKNIYSQLYSSVAANQNNYNFLVRSNDVNNMQNEIVNNVANQNITFDKNSKLAKRQNEINEWANSDKLDTLFVFQFIFISLLLMGVFGYLWRKDIISSGFLYLWGFILLIVNICIIVYRSKYTGFLRNNKYWNRRKFNKYTTPAPDALAICGASGLIAGLDNALASGLTGASLS